MTRHDTFMQLHQEGTFLLVNVHDAGAAVIAQAAGAQALGTTSSGHAYTLARIDGAGALSRDESIERVRTICAAVDIPVSVDAENGWGPTPEAVADTVRLLADAGASGASIEDWSGDSDIGFYDRSQAADRVEAAIDAARSLSTPFVICARAEGVLHGVPNAFDEVIPRLQRFAELGADCLYAPGPRSKSALKKIVDSAGGPVNALIGVGSELTMADAAEIGVRRVSVGGSLYRATMARFQELVRGMVDDGNFGLGSPTITDSELTQLFS